MSISRSTGAHLGKVFVSYSRADSQFVRRLLARLKSAGYDYWLDEKELIVGDSLSREVSVAINEARAVIIVVSQSSVASGWVAFELTKAAQAMIEGRCRLIPVLIDDVEKPTELTGLLYADCRPGKRGGMKRIIDAVEEEARRATQEASTIESPDALVRRRGIHRLVSGVFGGIASVSAVYSATRSMDWEAVTIEALDGSDVEVVYEQLPDYGWRVEPLTVHDWDEWRLKVEDETGERFGLLACERPLETDLVVKLEARADHVWVQHLPETPYEASGCLVVVDLHPPITDEEATRRIADARHVLIASLELRTPPTSPLATYLRGH